MKTVKAALLVLALLGASPAIAQDRYLGNLTTNPSRTSAAQPPPGALNNPYGNSSNSPKLYDSKGQFRGNLNANPYDPNSVANPYGRYGSQHSPDSINNPYGAGSPYHPDSPNNPFGTGMRVYGR